MAIPVHMPAEMAVGVTPGGKATGTGVLVPRPHVITSPLAANAGDQFPTNSIAMRANDIKCPKSRFTLIFFILFIFVSFIRYTYILEFHPIMQP
jgi:hypothetical protein